MKKFYVSPLVSEIEMGVELGFCQSYGCANASFGVNEYFGDASEEE